MALEIPVAGTKSENRKVGAAASKEDRAKWTVKKIIQQLKMSIRIDYGGAQNDEQRRQVMLTRAFKAIKNDKNNAEWGNFYEIIGQLDECGKAKLADCLIEIAKHTRNGIATRMMNHIGELETRNF